MSRPGFLYVLSNDNVEGVKVGITDRHPLERARELWTTGVPTPFTLEYAFWFQDARAVEAAVHEHFKEHRICDGREFFAIEAFEVANHVIKYFIEGPFSVVHEDDAYWMLEAEKRVSAIVGSDVSAAYIGKLLAKDASEESVDEALRVLCAGVTPEASCPTE